MARPEWIEVGRVTRPHGVRGEVRIAVGSDNPERFREGSVIHARPSYAGKAGASPRAGVRLTIEAVRGQRDFPIVGFKEIKARETAESLRGYVLEIRAADLPVLDEDEFYPFDLVGLTVEDPHGALLGRVAEVIESPAHALLEVELLSGRKTLVPFISAAIPAVRLQEGYVVIEQRFMAAGGEEATSSRAESREEICQNERDTA